MASALLTARKSEPTPPKAGGSSFSGEKRDSLDRRICFQEGKRVACNGGENDNAPIPKKPETDTGAEYRGLLSRISEPDSGFTYNVAAHSSPTDGYMVSIYPERSFAKKFSEIDEGDISEYVAANMDLLFENADKNFLGVWHDPNSGQVFVDCSIRVTDPKEAEALCVKHDQKAYFDLKKMVSVEVNRNATSGGAAKGMNHHAKETGTVFVESSDDDVRGIYGLHAEIVRARTVGGGVGKMQAVLGEDRTKAQGILGENKSLTEHKLGCVLLPFPPALAQTITDWALVNVPDAHLAPDGRDPRPHCTALYGFPNASPETVARIRAILTECGPIDAYLGGTGLFVGGSDGDVLKVDVISPQLMKLNERLRDEFGIVPRWLYSPHCTIAYLKPEFSRSYTNIPVPFAGDPIHFDAAEFSGADGSKETIPLSRKWKSFSWRTKSDLAGQPCAEHPGATASATNCVPASRDGGGQKPSSQENDSSSNPLQSRDLPQAPSIGDHGKLSREKQVLAQASKIKGTDEAFGGTEIGSRDYDEIEGGMTREEKDSMEESLNEMMNSSIDETLNDYETDVDEREVAKEAGYSDQDVSDAIGDLIDAHDSEHADELKTVLESWYQDTKEVGTAAINEARYELKQAGCSSELVAAIDKYFDKAESVILDAKVEEEDRQKDAAREQYEYDYDSSSDRHDYLREFWNDHSDELRFSGGDVPLDVWGRDASGEYERVYRFETSDGRAYDVQVYKPHNNIVPAGAHALTMQFMDSNGEFSVTGAGQAHEVFSKVSAAAVALIQNENLDALTFTAAEKSRQRLYDRLVKTIARVMPEYAAVAVPGSYRSYVVIKRTMLEKAKENPAVKEKLDQAEVLVKKFKSLGNTIDDAWWTPAGWDDDETDAKAMAEWLGSLGSKDVSGQYPHEGEPCKPGLTEARDHCRKQTDGQQGNAKRDDEPHGAKSPKATKAPPGSGTKTDPYQCGGDIKTAARLLADGKHVELELPDQVSTLVDRLGKMIRKALKQGKDAPDFDLCKVSVPGTNLFCLETLGIPRIKMPQMRGIPVPGTYAATKKASKKTGKVDLSEEFIAHLLDEGIHNQQTTVRASHLRASQNQIVGSRVVQLVTETQAGQRDLREKPIFVTRDNYIVDGHHHWAAIVAYGHGKGKDYKVPVYKLDMDIGKALSMANEFTAKAGLAPKSGGPTPPQIKAFTGTRKDKLGHDRCYTNGVPSRCPKKVTGKLKAPSPKPETGYRSQEPDQLRSIREKIPRTEKWIKETKDKMDAVSAFLELPFKQRIKIDPDGDEERKRRTFFFFKDQLGKRTAFLEKLQTSYKKERALLYESIVGRDVAVAQRAAKNEAAAEEDRNRMAGSLARRHPGGGAQDRAIRASKIESAPSASTAALREREITQKIWREHGAALHAAGFSIEPHRANILGLSQYATPKPKIEATAAQRPTGTQPLAGTLKQIAWADKIRANQLKEAENVLAKMGPDHPKAAEFNEVLDRLKSKASAAFWIDYGRGTFKELYMHILHDLAGRVPSPPQVKSFLKWRGKDLCGVGQNPERDHCQKHPDEQTTGGSPAASKAPTTNAPTAKKRGGTNFREQKAQLTDQCKKWVNKIGTAKGVLGAVLDYIEGSEDDELGERDYADLNSKLRECPETLDCLDESMRNWFDSMNKGFAVAEAFKAPVIGYRGLGVDAEHYAALKKKFTDAIHQNVGIQLFGIVSTSLLKEKALEFTNPLKKNFVFEIKAKNGLYVSPLSDVYDDEEEVLQRHGTKYKVLGMTEHKGYTEVVLEEV